MSILFAIAVTTTDVVAVAVIASINFGSGLGMKSRRGARRMLVSVFVVLPGQFV